MFDSIFGNDDKPVKGPTAAEKLYQAVIAEDVKTAKNLLDAAGGSCEARQLATDAKRASTWQVLLGIEFHVDKETIVLSKNNGHISWPVISVDVPPCKD